MGMYPENNCKDRDQLIICRVLAFFQLVEFLFKFFLNISCGCFGFNCVQTYLILASNYLHHMNSYPASLSSKGQSKQSFRVLTNHPAGVKMYKNRWNNSKTGAATSMYTQWAKKWTSGCNEYIPQKLKSTLLEICFFTPPIMNCNHRGERSRKTTVTVTDASRVAINRALKFHYKSTCVDETSHRTHNLLFSRKKDDSATEFTITLWH